MYIENLFVKLWGGGVAWPTILPLHHHHSKTQLDFLDLDNFLVNFLGGGGVRVVWHPIPPLVKLWDGGGVVWLAMLPMHHHHPKTQLDFLDLNNFLVNFWGDGGNGDGVV